MSFTCVKKFLNFSCRIFMRFWSKSPANDSTRWPIYAVKKSSHFVQWTKSSGAISLWDNYLGNYLFLEITLFCYFYWTLPLLGKWEVFTCLKVLTYVFTGVGKNNNLAVHLWGLRGILSHLKLHRANYGVIFDSNKKNSSKSWFFDIFLSKFKK